MNKVVAIKVEHVSKKYLIGENKNFPTLRDKLVELPRRIFQGPKKSQEYWALKDVSFEVKKGEVVGVIGRNGAGKSTLLKILARITEPTEGRVTMYGRVASMLEVGTGFNPELTGRENIYLNGAIIGMTKAEIRAKFDEIVEFSGVGKFLDTPVKHYSSGMYVRLAFAVAAHLDADILLVDEVLAVGDAEFQKKCLGKMSSLADSGRTVLYVSHDLRSINNLCQKVIYLENGKNILFGSKDKAINKYSDSNTTISSITYKKNNLPLQITKVMLNNNGKEGSYNYSEKIAFSIDLESRQKNQRIYLGIEIVSSTENVIIYARDFESVPELRKDRNRDHYHYECEIPKNSLAPGHYRIKLTTVDILSMQKIESPVDTLSFKVTDDFSYRKIANLPWRSLTSIPILITLS